MRKMNFGIALCAIALAGSASAMGGMIGAGAAVMGGMMSGGGTIGGHDHQQAGSQGEHEHGASQSDNADADRRPESSPAPEGNMPAPQSPAETHGDHGAGATGGNR